MTSIRVAIFAIATLAAAPAMAQSQTDNGGGGPGNTSGGGGAGGGSNARPDRTGFECLRQCEPQGKPAPTRVLLQRELCGQQLTYGRDAIYYYERCDRFM